MIGAKFLLLAALMVLLYGIQERFHPRVFAHVRRGLAILVIVQSGASVPDKVFIPLGDKEGRPLAENAPERIDIDLDSALVEVSEVQIPVGNPFQPFDPFSVGILPEGGPVGEQIGLILIEKIRIVLDAHESGVVLHADNDDTGVDLQAGLVVYLGAGPRHRIDAPGFPFKEDVHGPQRVQPDALHHVRPEGFRIIGQLRRQRAAGVDSGLFVLEHLLVTDKVRRSGNTLGKTPDKLRAGSFQDIGPPLTGDGYKVLGR